MIYVDLCVLTNRGRFSRQMLPLIHNLYKIDYVYKMIDLFTICTSDDLMLYKKLVELGSMRVVARADRALGLTAA